MGGIETFLFDLIHEQRRNREISVDVICFHNERNKSFEEHDGVKVFRMGTLGELFSQPISLSYVRKLRDLSKNYDILHLHFPNPLADLAVLLSGFKGKIVVHWHSDVVKSPLISTLYSPLMYRLLKRADKVIVTSPNYAEGSIPLLKVSDKVEVIPLGLNVERMKKTDIALISKLREKYKGRKIVFAVGRHIPYKGFEYLIRAAQGLPKEYMILIGGKGALLEYHQNLVKNLDLSDKVELLGFVSDSELSAYYTLCDVYVMSSIDKSEAFGVVQLEAMYFGKPIVSTAIPGSGVSWVNEDNKSGFIVPVRDSLALTKGILKLVNSNYYKQMSINAKDRVNEFFSSSTTEKQVEKVYLSLLTESED